MKESLRAAEDLRAHRRILAVIRDSVSEEKAAELDGVRRRRVSPAVAAMEERKLIASILEENPPKKKGRPKKSEANADNDGDQA